jgi:serine/threonine protein kinase
MMAEIRTAEGAVYQVEGALARGDFADLYRGRGAQGAAVLKIARERADNDLLLNEARVLRKLWAQPARQQKHLPALWDAFTTAEGHAGLALSRVEGAWDLHQVKARHPAGLPLEHLVWIMERSLSVLGYAHSQGVLHANVEPAHLLVRPQDHNVILLDWSCAVVEPARTGEGFRYLNEGWSAPEVSRRQPPLPAADLYALGRVMIWLAGGDVEARTLPEGVDERLVRLLRFCTLASPLQRAQDAWELYTQLRALREALFGGRRFRRLSMDFER